MYGYLLIIMKFYAWRIDIQVFGYNQSTIHRKNTNIEYIKKRVCTITGLNVNMKYQQLLLFVQQQHPWWIQLPSPQGSHQHMQ